MNSFLASILGDPVQVRDAEIDRMSNARKLRVVDEDDASLLEEPARVDEIEDDPLEAVVAIEEGEVEPLTLSDQPPQHDLRLLGVELDQIAHAPLLEDLEPDARVARPVHLQALELVRVGATCLASGEVEKAPLGGSRPETAPPHLGGLDS